MPAVSPERMFSNAPPSRDELTISRTCREETEVKTFTTSGMMAPASVPQVMIVLSFHHNVPSPRCEIKSQLVTYVTATEMSDVIQTSDVSGCSKLNFVAWPYLAFVIMSLTK